MKQLKVVEFAVYSKVKLTNYPGWFRKFSREYHTGDWHVTLKQTCFITESQIPDIKYILKALQKDLHFRDGKTEIQFSKLAIEQEKEEVGKTVMIRASNCKPIHQLQKKIVKALIDFHNYKIPESIVWERNFKPHLTLASNLKKEDLLKVQSYLKQGYACEGVIDSITLIYSEKDSKKKRVNYKFLKSNRG